MRLTPWLLAEAFFLTIMKKPEQKTQKTAHVWGKWVERPRRAEIFICACGNKYLRTRKDQMVCIRCL